MAKTPLSGVSVLNTPVVSDAVITSGKAIMSGIGDQLRPDDLIQFTRTPFNAGVISKKTYDLSGVAIVEGRAYRLAITHNGETRVYSCFMDAGDSTTDLQAKLLLRIQQDTDAVVEDNVSAAADLKLKLKATALNDGDFLATDIPDPAAEVVNTAYVAPAGTPSIVEGFDSVNASPTGEYTTYEIIATKEVRHNVVSGTFTGHSRKYLIFAEENAAAYAGYDARISTIWDNSTIDDARENSALFAEQTTLTATSTITEVSASLRLNVTAANADITLPAAATVPAGRIIPVVDNLSNKVVKLLKVGGDTINGGADITVGNAKTGLLFSDGISAWLWRELD